MTRTLIVLLCSCVTTAAIAHGTKQELVHKLGERLKDSTYHSVTEAYTLTVPALGATKVTITDQEIRPGVSAHVKFADDNGAVAGVVTQKIRSDSPKDDSILDRIKPRYVKLAQQIGEPFTLLDTKDLTSTAVQTSGKAAANKGEPSEAARYLELTLANEQYDNYDQIAFPFGLGMVRADKLQAMGVHRIFAKNGYLYEAILILPVLKNESEKDARKRVRKQLVALLKTVKTK